MASCAPDLYNLWWPEGNSTTEWRLYTNVRIVTPSCSRSDVQHDRVLRDAFDVHFAISKTNIAYIVFENGAFGVCPLEYFDSSLLRLHQQCTDGTFRVQFPTLQALNTWNDVVYPFWMTDDDKANAVRNMEEEEERREDSEMICCNNGEKCPFGRIFPRSEAAPFSPERVHFEDTWTCTQCIILPLACAMEEA